MDLVISFDDTGSMSSVRIEVRRKINELVSNLFKEIDDLRVGIVIHNDYCDHDTIQQLDLTSDPEKIKSFVNRNSSKGGGDADECYELVIHNLHSEFTWKSDKRVVLLIGDCNPHSEGYRYGDFVNPYDWREECSKCSEQGIKIYTIQALGRSEATRFYEQVAKLTNGIKLDLAQFSHIIQYITAVAYQQTGKLEEYEQSDSQFKTNFALKNMFAKLKGSILESDFSDKIELFSRFQVMNVHDRQRINDFVSENGIRYVKGKGYYQLIKSEIIQDHKEIIMVNKLTGESVSEQSKARNLLGLPLTGTIKINPRTIKACKDYDVYVQSTSYTRQLDSGTKFLYEVSKS